MYKYFLKTLLRNSCFSISSPTLIIWCVLFVCLFVGLFLFFDSSYLGGCEVVAFYFLPAFIVVLARGVGFVKAGFLSLETELRGIAS